MAFGNNNEPRARHRAGDEDGCEGNWACGQCKAPIEELPFKPNPSRLGELKCLNCFKASRPAR